MGSGGGSCVLFSLFSLFAQSTRFIEDPWLLEREKPGPSDCLGKDCGRSWVRDHKHLWGL